MFYCWYRNPYYHLHKYRLKITLIIKQILKGPAIYKLQFMNKGLIGKKLVILYEKRSWFNSFITKWHQQKYFVLLYGNKSCKCHELHLNVAIKNTNKMTTMKRICFGRGNKSDLIEIEAKVTNFCFTHVNFKSVAMSPVDKRILRLWWFLKTEYDKIT